MTAVDGLGLPRDSLLERFRNVREALPETAVAKPNSERFHRFKAESDDLEPACQRTYTSEWYGVDVEDALAEGLTPCRQCWKPVLEHLATEPASPVEYRSPDATPEPTVRTSEKPFPPEEDEYTRPTLLSLTDKVMIKGRSKFHAPAEGETLCGRTGYRIVDRVAVESHYEPCSECFTS